MLDERRIGMINRVIVIGRLTKDADLRYTPNGVAVTTFTIAVERSFASQNGTRETDFIQCVTWRNQAENLVNYTKKGCMIAVDGRIQTRNYEGQDGRRIYVTEILAESIQYLEFKRTKKAEGSLPEETTSHDQSNVREYYEKEREHYDPHDTSINISDDDLPF